MREARALWAGSGARRALAAGGGGAVEIALRPGGYVRLRTGDWLLVAHARAPRGPLTLAVTGLEGRPLAAGEPVRIADGALVLGERSPIALGSLGATPAPAAPPLDPGWREALAAALAACPEPGPELAPGLAALRRGDRAAAVAALAGLGPGLTPSGDDVLAGYAAWRHRSGAAVRLAAERCSPLGRAYLRCAERGELPEVAERVLDAIRAGDADGARRRARALSRWGASSGTAILWGAAAGASA